MPHGGPSQQQAYDIHKLEAQLAKAGYGHFDTRQLLLLVHQVEIGNISPQQAYNQAIANGYATRPHDSGGNGGGNDGGNTPPAPPGDPNAPSGGSSGSSGGSSSGGSSGPVYTPPTPPDYKNYLASYKAILHSWGIKADANIQHLMENAAHNKIGAPGPGPYDYSYSPWSTDRFMQALRHTKEYHQRFAGINKFPDMTEDQYISQEQQYQSIADTSHIDLSKKQSAYLFKNGVSLAEFQDRATAYQSLNTNGQLFDQFKEQLKAMGYKHPPSQKELFHWILSGGRSNKEWTRIWQDSQVRYSADQAGIDFNKNPNGPKQGGDLAFSNKEVGKIADKIAGGGTPASGFAGNFADLAQQLKTLMPLSRMAQWGVTKQDLVELEFGGSRQAAVADRVQNIINKMNNTDTATPYASSTNIGGRGSKLTQ